MGKMLFIEACADCRYFEYDHKTEGTFCTYLNRRKIAKTIDPSAEVPKWCYLPDWDGTIKDLTGE